MKREVLVLSVLSKQYTMKRAEELFKYRTLTDKSVPQRGGTKDYMPDGSWLQGKRLEKFHQERDAVLSEPRVQRICDLVKGEWNPDKQLVEFQKEMRNFWEHMGFVDKQRKWLHPEEALFLMESNVLEVWYGGIPLSIQQAYSMFLGEKFPLEYYQVYSHLRRIGYVVLRHQRSPITRYERQIKLDTYLSRRERKRALKLDKDGKKLPEDVSHSPAKRLELESDQDIQNSAEETDTGLDEEEDLLSVHLNQEINDRLECRHGEMVVLDIGNKVKHERVGIKSNCLDRFERDIDEMNDSESEINRKYDKQCRINEVIGEDMESTRVKRIDQPNMEVNTVDTGCENDEHAMEIGLKIDCTDVQCSHDLIKSSVHRTKEDLREATCNIISRDTVKNHKDPCETEKSGSFQGLMSDFSNLHGWNICHIPTNSVSRTFKISNWNFDEINFPDFSPAAGEKKVVLKRPNSKLLPGNFDLVGENYSFDRKEMINKKPTKFLNEESNWNEEILEFSYPEIMTGYMNVKKSCRNWTEYKNCQYQTNASWDRSHDLPHLYGDKVMPVVLPEDATSTSAILDKLHIIQEEQKTNSHSSKIGPEQKPVFDIYAPNVKFKKSAPGTPEHRVYVVKCNDPFSNLLQMSENSHHLQDDVSLLLALVDCGDIAFYELTDLLLPVDITMG